MVELNASEKRDLVEALRKDYPVRLICETLGFNRSLLYHQPQPAASEDALRADIETLALRHPTYGYRRLTHLLVRQGHRVGYRRVAGVMKTLNLSVSVKRGCKTTRSAGGVPPWGNRLTGLDLSRPDQVWVADMPYVRLPARFVYVALLMDAFTRVVRSWHISRHLSQGLTLQPLEAALCERVPEIHHSDQGVQYLSKAYLSLLRHHGVEISLARRGCPWENGYAERLIRTLKEEEVHLNAYTDIGEARARIGHFIEQVYNRKRPHSALGYLTPVEFERQHLS